MVVSLDNIDMIQQLRPGPWFTAYLRRFPFFGRILTTHVSRCVLLLLCCFVVLWCHVFGIVFLLALRFWDRVMFLVGPKKETSNKAPGISSTTARVPMPRPLLLGNLLVLDIPVWSHPYCLPGLITPLCLTFQFDHSRVLDIPVWSHSCAWHPSLIASYPAICWIHTTESCSTGSAKENNWLGERLRMYLFGEDVHFRIQEFRSTTTYCMMYITCMYCI